MYKESKKSQKYDCKVESRSCKEMQGTIIYHKFQLYYCSRLYISNKTFNTIYILLFLFTPNRLSEKS